MRQWRTQIHTRGGDANELSSTSYKTYSLKEARGIMTQFRTGLMNESGVKPAIAPISRWILDECIRLFFKDKAKHSEVLEKIIIEDTKHNGI